MLVHGHGPQSIIAIMLEMDLTTLKSLSINMDDVQRRLAQHDFEPPNNPRLKLFFILKYIKMIFFLFLKIIFDISTSK
jgi:hypothetical protein